MKYEVEFEVRYRTTINVEEGESVADACSEVNIPEDSATQYVCNTFDVLKVTDENGKIVDLDDEETDEIET